MSSGSLPAGISLSASGNLSGIPTATGTSSFTVKVTDANGQSATQATSISISAGVSTTFAAAAGGGRQLGLQRHPHRHRRHHPVHLVGERRDLAAGITLSAAGVLSGTPTVTGSYPFTVNVIDANKGIATASITLVVTAAPTLTFPAPPSGTIGTAYTDTLTAAGGTTPYTSRSARDAAGRHYAERVHRGGVRHPHHGRDLQLHGQGDRRQERDRHLRHLDHHLVQRADRRVTARRPRRRAAR